MSVINRIEAGHRPDDSRWATATNEFHFPWVAECDEKPVVKNGITCRFREVAYTEAHAKHMLATHQHLIYPEKRAQYLSLAELLWIELDNVVDAIMELASEPDNPDMTQAKCLAKGRAQGLAFAITRICTPYYTDPTAVSRESMKRWKIRNGQQDWEPTPGFKYDPPIPGVDARIQYGGPEGPAPTYAKSAVAKAIDSLGTKKVGDIKRALEAKMFEPADMARVYGVTVDVIEAIGKS